MKIITHFFENASAFWRHSGFCCSSLMLVLKLIQLENLIQVPSNEIKRGSEE